MKFLLLVAAAVVLLVEPIVRILMAGYLQLFGATLILAAVVTLLRGRLRQR